MSPLRIAVFAGRLMLALLLGASVHAADAGRDATVFELPTADRIHVEEFSRHIDLLEDAQGDLSLDRVARSAFTPGSLAAANVGFTSSVWWARVTFRNPGSREREIFVRQTYPLIDYLDVYEQTGLERVAHPQDRRPSAVRRARHRPSRLRVSDPCAVAG